MNYTQLLRRFVLGALLACVPLVGGCESKVKWQEEVKLSTGETITIDREVKHKGGGAAWPRGQGSIPMEHLIRFRYPAQTGPLIEWRSTKLGQPRGTYAELPLVLDLSEDKTWFIFTRHWPNEGCIKYVKYQLQNGTWTETQKHPSEKINEPYPLSPSILAEDIQTHPTNLFLAAGGNEIEGLISLAEKARENSSHGYPKHLRKVGPKRFLCRSDANY